jgi:hypothetical protein
VALFRALNWNDLVRRTNKAATFFLSDAPTQVVIAILCFCDAIRWLGRRTAVYDVCGKFLLCITLAFGTLHAMTTDMQVSDAESKDNGNFRSTTRLRVALNVMEDKRIDNSLRCAEYGLDVT